MKQFAVRAAPLVFVCLWATGFINARLAMPHAEPGTFLTLRFALAFVLIVAFAMAAGAPWPRGRAAWQSIAIGALLHGIYLTGVFWAVDRGMPAGIAALLVGLQPVLTAVLAAALLSEPVDARHWAGMAVGFAGVALVLAPSFEAQALSAVGFATMAACGLAVVSVTLGTVWQKAAGDGLDLRTATALQYAGGFLPPALLAFFAEERAIDWTWQFWTALVWSVLVLSIGAVLLLLWLIREGSVARVSSLFFLVPTVAALMAWGLFGERLAPVQVGGMALAAVGVALATRRPGATAKD